jgi:hypothetical protein
MMANEKDQEAINTVGSPIAPKAVMVDNNMLPLL